MEKAFGVSLVSQSPKNRKTLFRVLEDLPVKVQAVFTLAQIRRFMPVHHIDIAFCEEQLPDSSYREIFSAIRTVWHYFRRIPMATLSLSSSDHSQSVPSPFRRSCPYCRCLDIHRSHARGIIERHLARFFRLYPHRCESCDCRFYVQLSGE